MKFKIKEVGEVVTGFTPSTKKRIYYANKNYMFIGPSDMKTNKFVYNTQKHVSENVYNEYKQRFVPCNSIIVDCIGSDMGNVAIVSKESLTNQQINSICNIDEKRFNFEYIYYVLTTMKKGFHSIGSSGSTMPIINKTTFENFEIEIPNLDRQNKIVKILSDIDKKIELNNQINDNLQNLSQELYKRWFVDFEFPNEEGKPYKSSGREMIESELGEIPEGWEVLKASDYLEFERGVEPGSKNYETNKTENSSRFYRVGDMLGGNPIYVNNEFTKNKFLLPGDIAVSFDGTVGRIAIDLEGSYSTGIRKIYCNKNGIHLYNSFIYEYFKNENTQNIMLQNSRGTTIMHASSSIDSFEIPYNKKVFEKARKTFDDNFKMFLNISKENKLLINLRDTLLPKLLNGEIDLEQIEV